ncbi:MAG: phytanoyl-CoA dioxygenase family protein [Lentisphaeria bacterium]|nr:phytanoyl-CoA dioxygenase family protein [Lentisphaeria bacterium]NQZ68311.1 phytanoyl-CoA dioxygenase family protein [Lentisphaeria bacterium]
MTIEIIDVLDSLGVNDQSLSDNEKTLLDEEGYLMLGQLLSEEEVRAYGNCLNRIAEIEGDDAGKEVHQEDGAVRLSNVIDKDPMFEKLLLNPRLLAGVQHILGTDFKLSALNTRAALPGEGRQALHSDWGKLEKDEEYQVCIAIWAVDDFTIENGATRLIPGSHKSGQAPAEALDDPMADHPEQIQATIKSGHTIFMNAHIWHGGMNNSTDLPRRAMHTYFCRRRHKQQLDHKKYLSAETVGRLSPELRIILDV